MTNVSKLALLFSIFLINIGFSLKKNDAVNRPGEIVYSYEGGKMQCLSEQETSGKLSILIKSLDDNTKVNFNKLDSRNPDKIILVVTMTVDQGSKLCASWITMQEVTMVINPKIVEKTSLVGKFIYEANNIFVME